MNIGIVGNGVVGSATAKAWTGHCDEVRVYDVLPERCEHSLGEVLACDFIFVCLPTPQRSDGGKYGLDTTALDKFFAGVCIPSNVSSWERSNLIIKSTVPIGYTRKIAEKCPNVVHSPEFLTERTANHDALHPELNVVGVPGGTEEVYPPLARLYRERFPDAQWIVMDSDESEAMKLVMNSWFAVKVAFWNEVWTMTDKIGLDYGEIRDAIVDEGRVNELHTHVPGPDGKFGFGGACLPKDLSELIRTMNVLDLQPGVMRAAYDRNEILDRPRIV